MREHHTYRAAKRNLCHPTGALKQRVYVDPDGVHHITPDAFALWRQGHHARAANIKAKLVERRRQCEQAVKFLAKTLASARRTFTQHDINAALRTFWQTQKRTRVVHRILHDLRPATVRS